VIVDIHNHILTGMDDGAKSLQDSVLMAQQAADRGITHVIATPHHKNGAFNNRPVEIRKQTEELNNVIREQEIPLTVLPGMELHLHGDISKDINDITQNLIPLSEGNKYILIELPYTYIPHFTEAIFYQLQLMDYIPIIAHPERNSEIKRQPNRLFDLINLGALAQVTAASVVGLFGKESQRFTAKLLKHNLVHFIASDAHNTTSRSFELVSAYTYIEEHFSKKHREYLVDNAVHVVKGTEFHIIHPIKFERKKKLFIL
jgi:protein-tyrosine phosphatase